MTGDPFAPALPVADAVLYEGYVLYPYRASAGKNRLRWQFGVLAPKGHADATSGENWAMRTQCVVEATPDATIHARVRFLRVQSRQVEELEPDGGFRGVDVLESGGDRFVTWDEAVEHDIDLAAVSLADLAARSRRKTFELAATHDVEHVEGGRVVRAGEAVRGVISLAARRYEGPYPLWQLQADVENVTEWAQPGATRDEMARRSFVAAHILLRVDGGGFLSSTDPPEFARAALAECVNAQAWPVLVGDDDTLMLAAPIILPDHPEVAPESQGDMCDATEIDEILALRIMTLTDDEKREARGTDPRAAAIVDRADAMPEDVFERLHGAIRSLEPMVVVDGVAVRKGSSVTLRPGHNADAQDMFLAGKTATVERIFYDVDGGTHVAVTVDDDPGADLREWYGRYLFFKPEEVEPR